MSRSSCLRSLVLLLAVLVTLHPSPSSGQDVRSGPVISGPPLAVDDGGGTPHHPARLLIKLTPAAAASLERRGGLPPQAKAMGIASLDVLHARAGVQGIRRTHETFAHPTSARQIGLDRWHMVELSGPGQDIETLARQYRDDPNVEAATPDYVAFPALVPNDPTYPSQWGHNNTGQMLSYCWGCGGHPAGSPVGTPGFDCNAEAAWTTLGGYGSASVILAIIDSGVDLDHPDLVANLVAGWDHGSGDSNPDDDSASPGHGTACAGIAAARANNGIGVAGIAGNVKIMPLKVANNAGTMYFSAIQAALTYAADNGADIASMSLGASISSDPATDNAINYAYNAGVVLLAATGNGNKSVISYPAIHVNVLGVGAASPCGDRKRSSSLLSEVNPGVSTDPNGYTCDGERWWGSNYGVTTKDAGGAVDVIAPTILPTTDIAGAGGYSSGDYDLWFNGTSCSTPYAAGVCALILSVNPTWTPAQVRSQLVNTAIDIVNVESVTGWDRYSGYGMVDAAAAVGGGGPTPPAAPTGLAATAVSSSQINLTWTDNATNETSYSVERSTDGSSFSVIATLGANATSYSNTGLAASTTYWYRVRCANAGGNSGYSNTASATTQAAGGTWVTITYDDFESGMGTYTDGGVDMFRYTGGTYAWQGVAAANIQDNSGVASSFYTTTGRNVTSYANMEVQFYFRAQSMETGEDFWVQYYDGATWRTVAAFVSGTHFSNGIFYVATVPIPKATYAYPTGAKLRFMCDASNDADDVYIDAITWRGLTGSAAVEALSARPASSDEPVVRVAAEAEPTASAEAQRLAFRVEQNYPNPFRDQTAIRLTLPGDEDQVTILVFDIAGRHVATLANGRFAAGEHTVRWDARGVPPGLYFYRVVAGEHVAIRRLLVQ